MREPLLAAIVGEAEAGAILSAHPQLVSVEMAQFSDYATALRGAVDSLRAANKHGELGPLAGPDAYASRHSLQVLVDSLSEQGGRDERAQIDCALLAAGHDAERVHALIGAFKPGSLNFIGGHRISLRSVRKNMGASSDGDVERLLKDYGKLGLIEGHLGAYSLTAHPSAIQDGSLRRAYDFYVRSE